MDKKEFFEPTIKVVELDKQYIVCASEGGEVDEEI